jgi:ABC-2 type transport system permease protein
MTQGWPLRPQPVRRTSAPMKDIAAAPVNPPQPRDYHGANWGGLKTLYVREVRRFWKVGMQTVFAPVVTSLLYMMVFGVATVGARPPIEGTPFVQFVAPGLIMMSILNNAFANSSSSILQAKMQGLSVDFLTPPLSPWELSVGFILGAATRGVVVGLVTALCILPFAPMAMVHPWAILYFGLTASLIMGMVGVAAGLWAEKFDHMAVVTNFVVLPLTFLSGTFYLVDRLPPPFDAISHFNPMFYMIDGFRYGFIGQTDGSVAVGAVVLGVLTIALALACWGLFRTGYRLKT